jgi:mannose-6-phosphate isomerase-like protein (cupin superfamily)
MHILLRSADCSVLAPESLKAKSPCSSNESGAFVVSPVSHYSEVGPHPTLDGSEIRELMHPDHQPVCRQSLAEALVAPGLRTRLHRHRATEEIYHITAGQGLITLAGERFRVDRGDSVLIPPGTPHCIENTGALPLRILCCCSPAYRHDDTELLD